MTTTYDTWMAEVEQAMETLLALSPSDFPAFDYEAAHAAGLTPAQTAEYAWEGVEYLR